MPIEEVGQMPWWAYKAAEEGLSWEQPWIPRVEMVEVQGREAEPAELGGDLDTLGALGFNVGTA